MKVAGCQINPEYLELHKNIDMVISKINDCKSQGANLIVFPELALTGYFVGERYHEVSLKIESDEINRIVQASKGTAVVVGFIEESKSMNFYNSALVAVDGQLLYAYRKLNLPNYGAFEERKIFSSGKKVHVFRLNGFNVAVLICNDLWHPSIPYLGAVQKADIFVTLFNSSEGSMGDEFSNIESWSIINRFYSRIFGVYNIAVNRVGKESFIQKQVNNCGIYPNGKNSPLVEKTFNFWGGSVIINPFGNEITKAKMHEEDQIFADIDIALLRKKKILLPYLRNDDPYFTQRELNRILFNKNQIVK